MRRGGGALPRTRLRPDSGTSVFLARPLGQVLSREGRILLRVRGRPGDSALEILGAAGKIWVEHLALEGLLGRGGVVRGADEGSPCI